MGQVAAAHPLPTLLSQVLVAFTVEFDNESEHLMVHQTTNRGGTDAGRGPWLVSQVMWANVMRYVDDDGIRVGDLHARARTTRDSLNGLQRWGYVSVTSDPTETRPRPRNDDLVVRPTRHGRRAREIWAPLTEVIEGRWRERFGQGAVDHLRDALQSVQTRVEFDLPDYLPIVHPTQNGKAELPSRRHPTSTDDPITGPATPDLSALLSQVLLAFTLDFEQASSISLPISANTLRVLTEEGVRVRDLPPLTGVSKEANAMAVGFLERHGCAVTEADPTASRGKIILLTAKGTKAQGKYQRVLKDTETAWEQRFGETDIGNLSRSLDHMVSGPLLQGIEPYSDGWRASVRRPDTLPHYPMVLQRGGYPDGS